MKSISCFELYNLIGTQDNFIILDIRNKNAYLNGHIINAINYPSSSLLSKRKLTLKSNYTYYVICDLGLTSPKVVRHLLSLGYNAINVSGGMKSWIYPIIID